MEALWNQFLQVTGDRLPSLLGALGILLLGWFLSVCVSAVIRRVFVQTGWDRKLLQWITGQEMAKTCSPGVWVAQGVFYFLMLMVLVAFFQALGLTIVTEPLNQILVQVSDFAPRVVSAGLLLIVAMILARLVKAMLSRLVAVTGLDKRVAESAGKAGKEQSVADATSNAGYWLVFLLFLPAVLDALSVRGLMQPVQEMVNKILSFLPNLFAGVLIGVIGMLVARIAQQITSNILSAAGIDRLAERIGASRLLGAGGLSKLAGLLVYVLIIIPVVIAALDALQLTAVTTPASDMLGMVLNIIPLGLTAALLLLVAYIAGEFVSKLVTNLLEGLGINTVLDNMGLAAITKRHPSPAEVIGYLVKVAIILFASIEAARIVGLVVLADLLRVFIDFAGRVLVGLVIFGLGLYLAGLVSRVIKERRADEPTGLLATVAKGSIVVLATAMGLQHMGLANEIITTAFTLLLGAVAVALALAAGLGGRDIAARELESWLKNLRGGKS